MLSEFLVLHIVKTAHVKLDGFLILFAPCSVDG